MNNHQTDYKNLDLKLDSAHDKSGTVSWQSPSNIAIIKYWGKRPVQLPQNPSISLTLDRAHTITTVNYSPKVKPIEGIDLQFFFEGKEEPLFADRIMKYLENLVDIFPFLNKLHLVI